MLSLLFDFFFFFFNDTATTEIYTLSLHDALPICSASIFLPRTVSIRSPGGRLRPGAREDRAGIHPGGQGSEGVAAISEKPRRAKGVRDRAGRMADEQRSLQGEAQRFDQPPRPRFVGGGESPFRLVQRGVEAAVGAAAE